MTRFKLIGLGLAVGAAALALAMSNLGAAPNFTLDSSVGKEVSLSSFKGKYVVLEWWNNGCPYVQKHYNSGNMQKLQKQMKDANVVWLTIVSSAPGKQGYVTPDQANSMMKEFKGLPAYVLHDPDGKVGKLYNAKTTPQMVLISPNQEVLYNGAIDSIRSANPGDIERAENYLLRAYNEAKAGKPVSMPSTQPYGCNVKYAN
jgi:peroxiredoxin